MWNDPTTVLLWSPTKKILTKVPLNHTLYDTDNVRMTSRHWDASLDSNTIALLQGVNGSVCQDWAVDWAPTDIQNGPANGSQHTSADQTLIPGVPVASSGLKPKGMMVWREDIPALTSLAWAAKPINATTPGLGTSVCYLPIENHHALVVPAQPTQGECRRKYK